MYQILADCVLIVHVIFVLFVVLMVPLIFIGGSKAWSWIRSPWIRWLHLIGILIVVLQSWLGMICPLTIFEMWLRRLGGEVAYTESFVEHWMQRILYWDLPWWVFVAIYSFFAVIVLAAWLLVPPRPLARRYT